MSADDLAKFILRRARELTLSRVELANRASLSRQALYKLLGAETAHPDTPTIIRLANALDVAPLYLLRVAYGGSEIPLSTAASPKYAGDHGSFVRDVTYPDNSLVSVNQEFEKIWEIQNSGSIAWADRSMRCIDPSIADLLGEPASLADLQRVLLAPRHLQVPVPVTPPGATARISVWFRAPPYPCSTISRWRMVDAAGGVCMPGLTGIWCLVTVVAL